MNYSDPDNNISETASLHIRLSLSQRRESSNTIPPTSMSLPPKTTPVPQPVFMPGMSHHHDAPTPTPAPSAIPTHPNGDTDAPPADEAQNGESQEHDSSSSSSSFDIPRLRLHIQDIGHAGSSIFLSSVNASTILPSSIRLIHKHLYSGPDSSPSQASRLHPPPTRSVTLILRAMDGVAYTTGSDLDADHKEIHFSLPYITSIAPPSRRAPEIAGVLLHELVHCYQWNGLGRAPGGLVEGVADWVRLRSGLAPPHWQPGQVPAKWDVGYQGTAYFLEYLEARFGDGTVRRLNEKLRKERYEEKAFWTELLGGPVEQLFEDYKKTLVKDDEKT